MGCLEGLAHGFKTINHVYGFKTMYNKTMGCLEGLAHGFKTINHVHGFKTMCTWFAHGFKTTHIRNKCRPEKNLIWGRCCNLPN